MKAVLFSCAALFALSLSPASMAEDHGDGHHPPMYDCYADAMCHGKMLGHQDPKMCMADHGKSVFNHKDKKCHELMPHHEDHPAEHPGH